ncbi:MAG: hypothetical protein MI922_00965 [Bacteroidales bacterium]|nr:hypothetical protein [Bacteroidales bacterium]
MNRIILYRYYHKFQLNRELLKFIEELNPNVKIYGIYGGDEKRFDEAESFFKDHFTHNYCIRGKDDDWKWKGSDMAFQLWYNDIGHTINFDMMHAMEWDLLYFDSLDNLFAHIPKDGLGITGLIPLKKIEKTWYWTKNDKKRKEWKDMMNYFHDHHNYDKKKPYGMLGPGESYPKSFLESIRNIKIPDLSVDELRIPVMAQTFGFDMYDTFFYRKWFSEKEKKVFNSNGVDVQLKTIKKNLKRKKGRRVFHPVRIENMTYEKLMELYSNIKN